ncbi:pilus assembly protein [Dermabacteraceae bacterium TAE3-ERU27]|nr:pilus assembly protein [Dermabacteraceae bacterium TAE3-ERU27]
MKRAATSDTGTVTAETALVLPVVVLLLAALAFAAGAFAAQGRLQVAARDAARELARGEGPARAEQIAAQTAEPGSRVKSNRVKISGGESVTVHISREYAPLKGWPGLRLDASATALRETAPPPGGTP